MLVGYARVSTTEQSYGTALDQQKARLWGAGAVEVVFDIESGKRDDRPNFRALLDRVKCREVQQVVITRIDRLTRSLPTLRKTLDVFNSVGAELIALDDAIDMRTAGGKFHINMLGALAEMESDRLSERILRGRQYFRDQRKASHPPFAYRIHQARHVLDTQPALCRLADRQTYSRAQLGRWLVEQYLTLSSLNKTSKLFAETFGWVALNPSALRRWLTSPVLQGDLVYFPKSENPEIHRNIHEPLITREEAARIERMIRQNKKIGGFGARAVKYPLSGLVKCQECGGGCVVANGSQGRKKYYLCAKARGGGCTKRGGCPAEEIEAAVIKALCSRAIAIVGKVAEPEIEPEFEALPEVQEVRSQLATLEAMPFNPAIEKAKRDLLDQIEDIRFRRQAKKIQSDEGLAEILIEAGNSPKYWRSLPNRPKRQIYQELIDRIVICERTVVSVLLKI